MEHAIELSHVDKSYGPRRGIEDVSLDVPIGTLFGFIGPNGAGKTTTIRILLGLLAPTRGVARLFGVSCATADARESVGYVAGETHLVPGMRVSRLLAYLGSFHAGDHRARRAELVARFDLDPDAPTDDLSLGTKRKVALVAALQHAPRLLVLDEPTSGLDPIIRARLCDTLRDEVGRGTTVFLSSHVLSEVEALCSRVAVIANGRLVTVDDVTALRARKVRRVSATFAGGGDGTALQRLATLMAGVSGLERHGTSITFSYRGPMPPLLDALAASSPTDVQIDTPSLEDVFLDGFMGVDDHVV
jgi:ABC-2 type transport system ATP-binding protein